MKILSVCTVKYNTQFPSHVNPLFGMFEYYVMAKYDQNMIIAHIVSDTGGP